MKMKSLQNKLTDKRTGDLNLCFDYEDVKEAVLDYKKFYFSEEFCIDEKIINDICIKYGIDVYNDSDLDIFYKIFGDFEK